MVNRALKILKKTGIICGYGWLSTTIIIFILSFTTVPFWGIYQLAQRGGSYEFEPEYLIFMGGSGFPGKSSLLRLYHTSKLAHQYPESKIIAAFPGNPNDSTGMLTKIMDELAIRGIDSSRVQFEHIGTNTRWQALEIKKNIIKDTLSKIVIVSSPSHIYRTVKVFQNIGYDSIGSFACFERDIRVSLNFYSDEIEGKDYIPDVGQSQQLRYQFWNHLKYEIELLREYMAISYYYLNGWI
jgi:uncharacterized SAM-binding protein YcdF (DUF218 family)